MSGVRFELRVARAAIVLLAGLAVAAPIVALDRPFFADVPASASTGFGALPVGRSFPWFTALFDTRYFESVVDRAFNGLLVVAPAFLIAWFATRRARPRARVIAFAAWCVAGIVTSLACAHKEPTLDWSGRLARIESDGGATRAIFPPVPFAPNATDVTRVSEPPSGKHWLGTDPAGRDVFTRLLYGVRISLTIGWVSTSIAIAIGVLLGALAGFRRGWVEAVVLRLIETFAAFPAFLLVMALVALSDERSVFHLMAIIGLTGWTDTARLVRAEFLSIGERDYAVAARALGVPASRVMFRHLLPNALAPVLVIAAFGVAASILVESGLAFLDLGDAQVASWGQVLRAGRQTGELHLILAPGLLIFFTVTMMNVLAEGLRDRLDPRLDAARTVGAATTR